MLVQAPRPPDRFHAGIRSIARVMTSSLPSPSNYQIKLPESGDERDAYSATAGYYSQGYIYYQ